MNNADSFSSTSSSSVTNYEIEEQRHKKKKTQKDSKKRQKDKKPKKKKKSSSKKHKREKKRKRHHDEDIESISTSGEEDNHRYERKKDHKRRHRKDKRKRQEEEDINDNPFTSHNSVIGALHSLLQQTKPEFASELPIILIRLAGGTTFDLRQVTDPEVSQGLHILFTSMETFGVKRNELGMWMFQPPPGPGMNRRNDLVLLQVLRSILNDVGLTMDAITNYEHRPPQEEENIKQNIEPSAIQSSTPPSQQTSDSIGPEIYSIKQQTIQLLTRFQSKDSELGPQLIGLCKMIAEGESVSLDGLSDQTLKDALEALFASCGLEKYELENEEDSDDDETNDIDKSEDLLMGYGLPEDASDDVHIKLATIMSNCRTGPPKRRPVGPMRQPSTKKEEQEASALYAINTGATLDPDDDEEEEDGPLLPGQERKERGHSLSPEVIRAQAEYRELQLKATVAGVNMPIQGQREEWMVLPGKYDFLSNIKSGQPLKSRGFQNKKSRDDEQASAPIHPAVQAEMDAIMKAHQDARGPSLMDQHLARQQEKDASATSGKKKEWKWTRDKDLDAGRRVDKDALGMILGGAAENLKTKFQGGFNR